MTLSDTLTRYTAQVHRRATRPHLAYRVVGAVNDNPRCAACGKLLCGCDDHRWNGSGPSAA